MAQDLEHSYQNTLLSSYTAVAQGANDNWYFAGGSFQPPWFYSAFLKEVSPDGQVVGEWPLVVPENEVTAITDLMTRADGSLLLAGYVSLGCDVGPIRGLACSFFEGDLQWQRTYAMNSFGHAAQNDSLLVFASLDGLLFTNHEGDSLYTIEFPNSQYPRRVCSTDQGFVTMGYFGARSVLADGTLSDSLMGVSVHDMLQLPGGALLALTADSLLELGTDLQRTGNGVRVVGYEPRRVAYTGGVVRVHTVDTLFSFTPGLVELNAIPTEQPWQWYGFINQYVGYWPGAVAFTDEVIMTAGNYKSGVTASACRSFALDTPPTQLETDAELRNLTIDSITYTLSSSTIQGSATVRTWLHNSGDALLTSVTLNHLYPAICGDGGQSRSYDTLALAPGDSIQLEFGPFPFYQYFWQPDSVEICIWSARPNHRVDRGPIGNEVCTYIVFGPTTSSPDLAGKDLPAFFPNPASRQVALRPDLPHHGPFDVTFLDLQGRSALRQQMNYSGTPVQVELTDLEPGVYIAVIAQAGHRSSHRLVVE